MPSAKLDQLTSEVMDLVLQPELEVIERRTARRRLRRRAGAAALSLGVLSSAATLVLLTGDGTGPDKFASAGSARCRVVEELARPPGYSHLNVYAADRTGRHVIGTGFSDEEQRVYLMWWRDGVPTAIDIPGGPTSPADVNSAGTIVGSNQPTTGGTAWMYREGRLQTLPTPPGFASASAQAINERGDVAGVAEDPSGATAAVLWPAAALGKPRILDAPRLASVAAIGEDGTVVGSVGDDVSMPLPLVKGAGYVWTPDGRGRELPMPAGWTRGTPMLIHDGWILGSASREVQTPTPALRVIALIRWRLDTGEARILPHEGLAIADTTASGWAFVWAQTPLMVNVDGNAVELIARDDAKGTQMISGGGAVWAGEDGDDLTVIGNANDTSGFIRPVRWLCAVGA